ncbi:MAG: 30S ribosome-binding factor RbfA [Phycisphaerae bacterium]|nr:30S ribosome-binding factor RbfA [Phycisphaerae bacterium]
MTRRIEKLTRNIRDIINEVIQQEISDPRLTGLVSITHIKLTEDVSVAKIYLSFMGTNQAQEKLSFEAVKSAKGYIRTRLAGSLHTRTCPELIFLVDDSLKKSMEVSDLLKQVSEEFTDKNTPQESDNPLPKDDGNER